MLPNGADDYNITGLSFTWNVTEFQIAGEMTEYGRKTLVLFFHVNFIHLFDPRNMVISGLLTAGK